MRSFKLATALAATALASGQAFAAADDNGNSFHPLVGVALTVGGDSLARVQFEGGDTRDVKAGNRVALWGGVEYRMPASQLAVQGTFGYHFDNTSASNGNIRFERFPIEASLLWSANAQWRLGGGLRYASNARLVSDGATDIGNHDFQSELAPLVMIEWLPAPKAGGIQLRYVHETYKINGVSIDGSHVGLGYNYYF